MAPPQGGFAIARFGFANLIFFQAVFHIFAAIFKL
jgi:hypothetical protein